MKIGKVKRKSIFLGVVAWIFFHSVIRVTSPAKSARKYVLPANHAKLVRTLERVLGEKDKPSINPTAFKNTAAVVKIYAGAIVINMSKQEKRTPFFVNIPDKSFPPYFPIT